jgi:hypothetical protein
LPIILRESVHFRCHAAGPEMGVNFHWISGEVPFRMSHSTKQLQKMTVATADSECRRPLRYWLHGDILYPNNWRNVSWTNYATLESIMVKLLT